MQLRLLDDLWDPAVAELMDEPERLRYRSNLLGHDLRLTNFGGGNTSAKISTPDPITGTPTSVLWVKGSGGDLGSIKRDGFATVRMDRLLDLKTRYRGMEEEDEMPGLYPQCAFGGNPRAASIDTPLHAFLPYPHVDHLHPDWAIAIAASANGPRHLEAIQRESGLKLGWIPWKRPGFELGLWLERCAQENPDLDGIVLASHGLFTWGDTSQACYRKTIQVVDALGQYVLGRVHSAGEGLFSGTRHPPRQDRLEIAAKIFPRLRGEVGPAIGSFDDSDDVLRFIGSRDAEALVQAGTSCPDHFLRTKVRPLLVDWDPRQGDLESLQAALPQSLERYRKDYREYYDSHRRPDSPAIRSTNPTVVLVPGVGMFSFGRNKSEARITGEFYVNAINVMAGATCLGDHGCDVKNYVALPFQEAFDIEYWSLEEAKLQRMPPENELSRKVAVVVGASPGIGASLGEQLAIAGAHVVMADLNPDLAAESAGQLTSRFGKEMVAADALDITNRETVGEALDRIALVFGGIDIVVNVAAIFVPPDRDGTVADADWRRTFEINVLGSAVLCDEARHRMPAGGSIVLISSANAVVPKKGSVAYDTSKAAVNHLVRELAIELAPSIRVNAVAPATVVEGSQMFPRERVIASLTKYRIDFDEGEDTEALRARLSQFYAERTLLRQPVSPRKVAEAAILLCTDRLSQTTGHVIPVDAGLAEAFLR